jgi:transposase
MARELVDDELWEIIQPLLPVRQRRKTHPGRKPLDDRRVLTGILFVLRSGIPWEMLPQEMGCGSGMTCWRRVHAWQKAGVWQALHRVLLDKLRGADKLDFSRVVADSSSVRAVHGGKTLDRTQPIAARRAANIISSSTRKGFRSMSF